MARGLLFDFDGTLYGDWQVWTSIIQETLSDFQVSVNSNQVREKARAIIEEEDGGSNGTLRISSVAAALARNHKADRDEVKARFFERLDTRMDETGPEQGLVNMLGVFQREGFRLGIVTFVRKPRITRRLEVWKLKQYFESVLTPDDVSDFKPSPTPYVKAMDQLEVPPSKCFVIGDEPVDIIGGKKAQATTVGLPQGFFTRAELERAGADYIISSLSQLPDIVVW